MLHMHYVCLILIVYLVSCPDFSGVWARDYCLPMIVMMAGEQAKYWICSCFFTRNIFLQQQRLHVVFYDESQFFMDYKTVSPVKKVHMYLH